MNQDNIRIILSYCSFDLKYFEVSRVFEAIYTSQIYTESFCKLLVYEQLKPDAIKMIKDRNLINHIHLLNRSTLNLVYYYDSVMTDNILLFINAFEVRQLKFEQQQLKNASKCYWKQQNYIISLITPTCDCCVDEHYIVLEDTRLRYALTCGYRRKPYKSVYYRFSNRISDSQKQSEYVNLSNFSLKEVIEHAKSIVELLK